MKNLNLAEILKDCPTGTKLYSPIFGDVELVKAFSQEEAANFHIVVKLSDGETAAFTKDGRMFAGYDGECMLFPSKEERDWGKFKHGNSKFDPRTLKPFDKVLVKTGTKSYNVWFPDFISIPPNDITDTILCTCIDDIVMAIPYNDDTKHLVGTNEEAPEFYRYWED